MHLSKLVLAFFLFYARLAYADGTTPPPPPPPPPPTETVEQVKAAFVKREEELKAEIEKLKGGKPPKDEGDLIEKARREKEDKDKTAGEHKEVERALKFNLTVDNFVKENKSFLPDEVDGILSSANKERYDTEFEKAKALKSAIVQSFFSVQANLETLTPSQKKAIEDWNGLTKSARDAKAADVYENIFEPCIDTMKRIKRAEEVGRARNGLAVSSDAAQAYKDKLIKASKAAHLGEKS